MRNNRVAAMIQNELLFRDGRIYRLSSWVVMPNHIHFLMTRFENIELADIMQSFKSLTAHKANRILRRKGQFWMQDYFDRYIRNAEHFAKAVAHIENNPVKAKLSKKPEDWPFSSAWFRKQKENKRDVQINTQRDTGNAGALARIERAARIVFQEEKRKK
jgi:putative transposase